MPSRTPSHKKTRGAGREREMRTGIRERTFARGAAYSQHRKPRSDRMLGSHALVKRVFGSWPKVPAYVFTSAHSLAYKYARSLHRWHHSHSDRRLAKNALEREERNGATKCANAQSVWGDCPQKNHTQQKMSYKKS